MAVNLIDLAKGYLTNEVVDKASSFLGESSEATQTGVDNILPALMGGMLSKANTAEGANDLFNMVSRPEMGGGLLNNVADLFGGGDSSNKAMDLGGTMLNMLMGKKSGGLIDLISSAAGMKSGSSSGLVKLLLPVLLSVIGKQVAGKGVGGLLDLLGGQKDHMEKAAPQGLLEKLAGALGLGSIASLFGGIGSVASGLASNVGDAAGKVVDTAADAGKAVVNTAGDAGKAVGNAAVDTAKAGGGMMRKLLPFLLLLLGAILLFFMLRGCADGKGLKEAAGDAVGDTTGLVKDAGDKVGDAAGSVVDFAADGFDAAGQLAKDGVEVVEGAAGAVYNAGADMVGKAIAGFEHLGKFVSRKVGDIDLVIPEWGFENRLLNFIEGKDKVSDDKTKGWFNLDRILFETGSANLDAQSQAQIDNIAAIMKANEKVNMKIGGYTDNTGNAEANVKLSDARANAVMNSIIASGVDAGRLSAEGYGEAHPVCPANDTEECRQKNRRVAARVTAK